MKRILAVPLTVVTGLFGAPVAPARAAEPVPIQLVLPAPTGPNRVGTVSLHLIDASRPAPWVPATPTREFMVQIWYPATSVRGYPRAPWVSPGVEAILNPPGSSVRLPVTHGHIGAPARSGQHPVVLYSPGLGIDRAASTALVEDLASRGSIVVTIDHTYEARAVEFPGGRVVETAMPTPTTPAEEEQLLATALAVRVADTRFTLDKLTLINRGGNPDVARRPLPRGLRGALDLSRVGMLGHSMGGATTAEAMYEDRRLRAGLNLDGSVFGQVVTAGLDRPFLLLGSQSDGDEPDETWVKLWSHLRGPRHQLELLGSGHLSFCDYQVLLPQSGIPPGDLEPLLGTIDGRRSVAVQRVYVAAFFDRYLRHGDGRLLSGPSRTYPEMRIVA
ncbi:alpha/beta hydrolase family protein [Virgisporangium aurantiacum]|uniref:Esterase n=1 Tax=Virgisporangium aurantiacum TaxID=175570 RepID=A0A8J3ZJP3_9ACTN|nr:hydrolase [Virgisporangium aurantiacum]GIJ64192.1 esterase [Virgisporangium aurantiacum]